MVLTNFARRMRAVLVLTLTLGLAACGGSGSSPFASFGSSPAARNADGAVRQATRTRGTESVAVNRYIWAASLDVLGFLPLQSVDPFTGVIVTGYGTPPGGGRAYKATIHITDPALEARSLNLALQTRSGPASVETVRAVEDAILSRARQLRIADGRL